MEGKREKWQKDEMSRLYPLNYTKVLALPFAFLCSLLWLNTSICSVSVKFVT